MGKTHGPIHHPHPQRRKCDPPRWDLSLGDSVPLLSHLSVPMEQGTANSTTGSLTTPIAGLGHRNGSVFRGSNFASIGAATLGQHDRCPPKLSPETGSCSDEDNNQHALRGMVPGSEVLHWINIGGAGEIPWMYAQFHWSYIISGSRTLLTRLSQLTTDEWCLHESIRIAAHPIPQTVLPRVVSEDSLKGSPHLLQLVAG